MVLLPAVMCEWIKLGNKRGPEMRVGRVVEPSSASTGETDGHTGLGLDHRYPAWYARETKTSKSILT